MFVPLNVNVPLPCLVKLPEPLIAPLKTVVPLLPPASSGVVPSATLPDPASEPMVSELFAALKVKLLICCCA